MPPPPQDFQHFFEKYYRGVYAFFEQRGMPHAECEDLAQVVFLKAYNGWDTFDGRAKRSTWLFQIAANGWRNELRHRAALKRDALTVSIEQTRDVDGEGTSWLDQLEDPEFESQPDSRTLSRERIEEIHRHLEGLPGQMRRCVLLRVTTGRSYEEIAKVLGVSKQTVKAHLLQARRRLRPVLEENLG